MLKYRTHKRIRLICSNCDSESEPHDVPCGRIEQQITAVDDVFSRYGWAVTSKGAWCPACKSMPR